MGKTAKNKKTGKKKNSGKKSNKFQEFLLAFKDKLKKYWKEILILVLSFILGLFELISFVEYQKANNAKNLDVAFYQMPKNLVDEIQKRVTSLYDGAITFTDISDLEFNEKDVAKKYELIFTKNGNVTARLEKYAEDLPVEWYAGMPTSLRRSAGKVLPFALDHYEMAYYKDGREKAGLDFPMSIPELQDYLKTMKGYVFSPFFCAGGEDEVLLAFVGALIEGFGGTASYDKAVSLLLKKPSLAQNIDEELSVSKNSSDKFTLRAILDMLRGWQNDGLVHPNWYAGKHGDLTAFMEDNQVGVMFTSLSVHRTIPYKSVKKFDADRVPVFTTRIDHGVIAPSYVAMKLTKYPYFDEILKDLVTDSSQKDLSMLSKLGPVSSRSQAYDRQADDVRFLAASCKDGPLPAIGDAVFQTNPEAAHKFAEEIRTYLRLGVLKNQ
jgi:hypothetical protein